jgi:hypothetical protein
MRIKTLATAGSQFVRRGLPGMMSLALLAAAAGCSHSAPVSAVASAGNACDRKLITKDDIAGLLSEPISKVEALQGDPQSCVFTTTGFSSVTVSIRPGLGDLTVSETLAGKTNTSATAVSGVGDRAAWVDILKEIDATKNNTLCDIGAIGPATAGATQQKIAALCAKIFASM